MKQLYPIVYGLCLPPNFLKHLDSILSGIISTLWTKNCYKHDFYKDWIITNMQHSPEESLESLKDHTKQLKKKSANEMKSQNKNNKQPICRA